MPAFPAFMVDWGPVVISEATPENILTVLCGGFRARGPATGIIEAIRDAKSQEEFETICKEREFFAEPGPTV